MYHFVINIIDIIQNLEKYSNLHKIRAIFGDYKYYVLFFDDCVIFVDIIGTSIITNTNLYCSEHNIITGSKSIKDIIDIYPNLSNYHNKYVSKHVSELYILDDDTMEGFLHTYYPNYSNVMKILNNIRKCNNCDDCDDCDDENNLHENMYYLIDDYFVDYIINCGTQ